jgi:hypothetical protein
MRRRPTFLARRKVIAALAAAAALGPRELIRNAEAAVQSTATTDEILSTATVTVPQNGYTYVLHYYPVHNPGTGSSTLVFSMTIGTTGYPIIHTWDNTSGGGFLNALGQQPVNVYLQFGTVSANSWHVLRAIGQYPANNFAETYVDGVQNGSSGSYNSAPSSSSTANIALFANPSLLSLGWGSPEGRMARFAIFKGVNTIQENAFTDQGGDPASVRNGVNLLTNLELSSNFTDTAPAPFTYSTTGYPSTLSFIADPTFPAPVVPPATNPRAMCAYSAGVAATYKPDINGFWLGQEIDPPGSGNWQYWPVYWPVPALQSIYNASLLRYGGSFYVILQWAVTANPLAGGTTTFYVATPTDTNGTVYATASTVDCSSITGTGASAFVGDINSFIDTDGSLHLLAGLSSTGINGFLLYDITFATPGNFSSTPTFTLMTGTYLAAGYDPVGAMIVKQGSTYYLFAQVSFGGNNYIYIVSATARDGPYNTLVYQFAPNPTTGNNLWETGYPIKKPDGTYRCYLNDNVGGYYVDNLSSDVSNWASATVASPVLINGVTNLSGIGGQGSTNPTTNFFAMAGYVAPSNAGALPLFHFP